MLRFGGLILVIAALAAGWYFAWNRGAAELNRHADIAIARIGAEGGRLECMDRHIEGFPFRIGIFCSAFEFAPPGGGAFSASKLRSAAQFYNPGHVISELDGPAQVQLPDGTRFELGWEALRSSIRANLDGMNALSFELRQPVLSEGRGTAGEQTLARSDDVQVHARRSPQDAATLDLAVSLSAVRDDKERFPGFSFSGDASFNSLADQITAGGDLAAFIRDSGLSGEARSLVLEPAEGGRLVLSGPFKVDRDGLLTGEIRIEATRVAALGAFFTALFPQESETIANIAGLLGSLDSGDAGADKPRSVTLTVSRGRISIGLIPAGSIPPLF
jgi:hypothetical protein